MKAKDPSCLIGYRLLNADLDKATSAFQRIFECHYESELKFSSNKAIEQLPNKGDNNFNLGIIGVVAALVVAGSFIAYRSYAKK